METQLSRRQANASIGDFKGTAAGMKKYIKTDSDAVIQATVARIKKNPWLISSMLFGSLACLMLALPPPCQADTSPLEAALLAGDYGKAEQAAAAAVKEAEAFGARDPRLPNALENQAMVYLTVAKYREAKQGFQRVVELLKQADKVDMRELSRVVTYSGERPNT